MNIELDSFCRFCWENGHVFEEAYAKVSSSVVSIFAQKVLQIPSFGLPDDPFRDFFGEDFSERFFGMPSKKEEKRTARSIGSGVIITSDGFILTNNHVAAKAKELAVITLEKETYEAKVIGTDPPTDLHDKSNRRQF